MLLTIIKSKEVIILNKLIIFPYKIKKKPMIIVIKQKLLEISVIN